MQATRGAAKILTVLVIVALPVLVLGAKSKDSQPPITEGCVIVKDIRQQAWYAGNRGVSGTVENGCDVPMSVTLTAGFFDRKGNQVTSRELTQTVDRKVRWQFNIGAVPPGSLERQQVGMIMLVRLGKIISVSAMSVK
jgi:hypothetical protein